MKTILITGSTDGIGRLAAIKLAKDGHHVIVHGRSSEKLENTIAEIKDSTNNQKIDGFISDLSDFESIKKMITRLSDTISKIDVLINNAGVFKSSVQSNQDGIDLRFTVNYLAPYELTNGLVPLLKNSNAPRVINLSSAAQSSVNFEALWGEAMICNQEAYAQSKLALTMWSFAFAKSHPEIIIIAVNPGSLLNTNMVKEAYGHHWSSADKGANILYDLAVLDKYANSSGKYFDNDKGVFSNAHSDAYNEEKINGLISETEKILKG
ncbi:MAG: SDR family NAD(P)-dependent oxidoreductase [Bacteroidota bacterium]